MSAHEPENPDPSAAHAHAEAEMKLIEICENMVMQGDFLARNDILELADWYRAHGLSNIPQIAHLGVVLERVMADETVTPDEEEKLVAAIEAIVAPQVRAAVEAKLKA